MITKLQEPGDGYILNPNGTARKTRNLRPLLELARKETVSFVNVTPLAEGRASLEVHFNSGHKFIEIFASYRVCLEFASNPRRVWNRRGDLKVNKVPILEVQEYTVILVSTNTNSFGLKSILLLSATGEGWQVLKSPYGGDTLPKEGAVVKRIGGRFDLGTYECPRRLPDVSQATARKILFEVKN